MKKLIITFILAISLLLLNFVSSYASEMPVYDETYNNNQGAIYANGTSIVVSESEGQTFVSWNGGSQIVPNSVTIFGGGNGGTFESSQIIMNGGTVQNLVGGGIGYTQDTASKVGTSHIVINNGTVTNAVVGGDYFYAETDCSNIELNGGKVFSMQGGSIATGKISGINYSVGTKDDPINSQNRVNTANVTINNGTITSLLFGGGQGYSYTGIANLTIKGGNLSTAYVTSGGSNGYTGTANTKISGGNIAVFQSVNRGTVEKAYVKVDGGNIDKFYVGGETEDSTVTGTINNVEANLIGGNINTLNVGTSNSQELTIDNENYSVITSADVKIENDNIGSSKIEILYDFDIDVESVKLLENETHQLTLNIKTTPESYERIFNDEISFNSQNPEIATVDSNGIITGISKGSTTVEVTVGNKTKTINVEVRKSSFLFILIGLLWITVLAVLALLLLFFI